MATQTTERPTGYNAAALREIGRRRKCLVKMIQKNKELLGDITLPAQGFISEEHREATLAAIKAAELFDKLAEKYPI